MTHESHPTPRSAEWDPPVGPTPARRAAVFVWIVAAIEAVFFGGYAMLLAVASLIPLETLREAMEQSATKMPPEFEQYLPMMPWYAAGVTLFGVVPGVVLAVLGFAVRRGRPLAVRIALGIALVQAAVLALFILQFVAGALMLGNPAAMTLGVIMFGTPLALLVMTIRWLLLAMRRD